MQEGSFRELKVEIRFELGPFWLTVPAFNHYKADKTPLIPFPAVPLAIMREPTFSLEKFSFWHPLPPRLSLSH